MQNISSSATLFLKLIFPTIYVVFFSIMTLALFFTDMTHVGPFSIGTWRLGMIVLLLIGIGLIYGTLYQLKRVEVDEHFIYATDYFKTYRYPFHNVEKMVAQSFLIFPVYQIYLRDSGAFGNKITFLASRNRLEEFMELHPDIARQVNLQKA